VRIATSIVLPAALAAAALAGCGSEETAQKPEKPRLTWAESPTAKNTILVVRRLRYEGATLQTMYVHADGSVNLDIPNGGAGGSKYTGHIAPQRFATLQRQISRTPWGHLSRRKGFLDASGGYWIIRRGNDEHVAMSKRMSVSLLPLVRTMQGVFVGGIKDKRTQHRFGRL
jgi:hypothetical protein